MGKGCLIAFVIIVVIGAIAQGFQENPVLCIILFVALIGAWVYKTIESKKNQKKQELITDLNKDLIQISNNRTMDEVDTLISDMVTPNKSIGNVPSSKLTTVEDELYSIDSMSDGHEFERYMGDLLKKLGYENVSVTSESGDFGVDVLAERNKIKFAIQCKRYSQNVGISAVQEVYSGVAHYHCNVGIVATNQYFTEQAKRHASQVGVILWDRDELIKMLKASEHKAEEQSEKEEMRAIEKSPPVRQQAQPQLPMYLRPEFTNSSIDQESKVVTISAGTYVFGYDIPVGKYDLKAVYGNGRMMFKKHNQTDYEINNMFGKNYDKSGIYMEEYRNLYGEKGDMLILEGVSKVELKQSTPIRFD